MSNSNLIVLGITGCIAAYKSVELLRLLQKSGFEVQVVLTEHAKEFITPLTLSSLSQKPVITKMFDSDKQINCRETIKIDHIDIAQNATGLIIAPVTANCLAKFANGIADDFLSTLFLASSAPTIMAPAMNVQMWNNPIVQENVSKLCSVGVIFIDPEEGYLAEGIEGQGRMANLETILSTTVKTINGSIQDLTEETILVTAGPTCEDIDPVRFLTNRSSGKMGYAIATAAQERGAKTILVSGPTNLPIPPKVRFFRVRSAEEMGCTVLQHFPDSTILIKAAAVGDFKLEKIAEHKIKKNKFSHNITLVPTIDILSELIKHKQQQILVGFAAETKKALEIGRQKMKDKELDMIVINDITQQGAGFDSDTNVVTIISKSGKELSVGQSSKAKIAHTILDQIITLKAETCKK